ncbi:hypothetical protein OsI_06313 [Oryza sativa Indica Group]|nr:hypothetical protein OsI_06313 [Oryza sativa Indica Group]
MIQKVPKYLFEVGHGLEDSGKPFIWVVKVTEVATPEVQEWLSALEARVAGRGVVVRGWAPQLAILSHRAVGGFVTHCGCNSILEDITHGVPVVTWPHISDQFLNERLAVDVPVGATACMMLYYISNYYYYIVVVYWTLFVSLTSTDVNFINFEWLILIFNNFAS